MEQALIQVGLPVRCCWADCEATGFVKPGTDYGGWVRRLRKSWYCPEHAKQAQEFYNNIVERYRTPEPVIDEVEQTVDDLYKLIDEV